MQNKPAILLCNLKPSKMRGIMSEAMVMCASTPEKVVGFFSVNRNFGIFFTPCCSSSSLFFLDQQVEILIPPAASKPGDPVEVAGFARNPDAQLNPKKKVFETCVPDLRVDVNGEATFKGVPWVVNGEKCLAPSLVNVQIK